MKTPMQELIGELNDVIDLLKKGMSKDNVLKGDYYFEGMISAFSDVRSILRGRYLQKEKELIARSFVDGYEQRYYPTTEFYPHKAEEYYNENFNAKDK